MESEAVGIGPMAGYAVAVNTSYSAAESYLENNVDRMEKFPNSDHHYKMNNKLRYAGQFLDEFEELKEYVFSLDGSRTFHSAMIKNFLSWHDIIIRLSFKEILTLENTLKQNPTVPGIQYFYNRYNNHPNSDYFFDIIKTMLESIPEDYWINQKVESQLSNFKVFIEGEVSQDSGPLAQKIKEYVGTVFYPAQKSLLYYTD